MEWIPKRSRILASFIDRATLKLSLAPPVSWTFCEPLCGVGDQAVDAESAFENAQEDVREAVMAAFKREGIAMTDEKRTVLVYDTNSVLLDEFGDFFDHSGMRYHAENGVVVGRIDANRPKDILSYFVALEAKVSSDYAFGENIWRRLANDVLLHLIAHKQTRFRDTIAIIF
ncbi:hypothetical protein Tcan_17361 [Toxocara canis]|uniref:Uncharacterized protein n=1 Tax=Toxocara canis TaxID=6265 RepID=A0A0B2UND5_TOXCA|nr:hypothetical protein Tcan_17361 [Toxocara canis]